MEIPGIVQNGVVVFDRSVALPEGAIVTVKYADVPMIRVASNPQPVKLPIFDSAEPDTIDLTNDKIAELLVREDASS